MGRGRKPAASDGRVLAELLIRDSRAVFAVELADELPVGKTRVRQILSELADDGLVDIQEISGRNLYRLTDNGRERATAWMRDQFPDS